MTTLHTAAATSHGSHHRTSSFSPATAPATSITAATATRHHRDHLLRSFVAPPHHGPPFAQLPSSSQLQQCRHLRLNHRAPAATNLHLHAGEREPSSSRRNTIFFVRTAAATTMQRTSLALLHPRSAATAAAQLTGNPTTIIATPSSSIVNHRRDSFIFSAAELDSSSHLHHSPEKKTSPENGSSRRHCTFAAKV